MIKLVCFCKVGYVISCFKRLFSKISKVCLELKDFSVVGVLNFNSM